MPVSPGSVTWHYHPRSRRLQFSQSRYPLFRIRPRENRTRPVHDRDATEQHAFGGDENGSGRVAKHLVVRNVSELARSRDLVHSGGGKRLKRGPIFGGLLSREENGAHR